MANELGPISLQETETGAYPYILLRDNTAKVWDNVGNSFVTTYVATDQTKYAIGIYVSTTKQTGAAALLLDNGTATYYGDKPTEITATGNFFYEVWQKLASGDTPDPTKDVKVESGTFAL